MYNAHRPAWRTSTAWRCMRGTKRSAPDELRQRACTELLRQAAQRGGLLAADDAPSADGVISEAAGAIEALLEQALQHARAVGGSLPASLRRA